MAESSRRDGRVAEGLGSEGEGGEGRTVLNACE
jgi:hypothetical protein